MTEEQLISKIKEHPTLIQHFRRSGNPGICPCCVSRFLKIPDQQEAERVLDAIGACAMQDARLTEEINRLTRQLRASLDANMGEWRKEIHRFYELRNNAH